MKIYYLKRLDEDGGYDEAVEFVIIASSAKKARQLASNDHGDEGPASWIDSDKSTIECIGIATKQQTEGIVVKDYRGS